jgi:hypothetical protein
MFSPSPVIVVALKIVAITLIIIGILIINARG